MFLIAYITNEDIPRGSVSQQSRSHEPLLQQKHILRPWVTSFHKPQYGVTIIQSIDKIEFTLHHTSLSLVTFNLKS